MTRNSSRLFLFTALLALTVAAMACGTDDNPSQVSIKEFQAAARAENVALKTFRMKESDSDGLLVRLEEIIPQEQPVGAVFEPGWRIDNNTLAVNGVSTISLTITVKTTGPVEITGVGDIQSRTSKILKLGGGQAIASVLSLVCYDSGPGTFAIEVNATSVLLGTDAPLFIFDGSVENSVTCVTSSSASNDEAPATSTTVREPDPEDEEEVSVRFFLAGGIRYPTIQFDSEQRRPINGVPVFGFDDLWRAHREKLDAAGAIQQEITTAELKEIEVVAGDLRNFCDAVVLTISTEIEPGDESQYPILGACSGFSDLILVNDGNTVGPDPSVTISGTDLPAPTEPPDTDSQTDPNFVALPDSPVSLEKGFRLAVLLDERRHIIGQTFTVATQVKNATREWDPGDSGLDSPLNLNVTMVSLEFSPTIRLVDSSGLPFGEEGSIDSVPLAIDQVLSGQVSFQCTGEERNGVIVLLARSTNESGLHHADSRERLLVRCELLD